MLQTIPTRIAGAAIVRHTPARRADGSAVLVRRRAPRSPAGGSPHEQIITADFGYTCEPSFTRVNVERSLYCLEGELYACLVDVRVGSPSFGHWQSVCLSEGDLRTLTIPAGVACGWQVVSSVATLELNATRDLDDHRWQWLSWNDHELDLRWPELPEQLASHTRPSRYLSSFAPQRLPRWLAPSKSSAAESDANAKATSAAKLKSVKRMKSVAGSNSSAHPKSTTGLQATAGESPVATRTATNTKRLAPQASPANQRILVIGSSGQLGRDLCRHLRSLGTVIGACRTPDKQSLLPVPMWVDISRPASLRQAIRQVRPTLIVNAAGLTDIDQAERHPRLAQLVNATGPAVIAAEARRIDACLVHFCSSMVFSGEGEKPWRESDQPDPQNQYARTKWVGTQAVSHSQVPHLILRSGWLYSTHGENYVRRLIDSLSYRSSVTLADDHFGSPTSTDFLAQLTAELLQRASRSATQTGQSLGQWLTDHGGLFHASTLGMASKLQVGDQILALCRQHGLPIVLQKLQGRRLSELPSAANIPANCALDPSRLAVHFQVALPRWQTDLEQQIDRMLGVHSLALGSVA